MCHWQFCKHNYYLTQIYNKNGLLFGQICVQHWQSWVGLSFIKWTHVYVCVNQVMINYCVVRSTIGYLSNSSISYHYTNNEFASDQFLCSRRTLESKCYSVCGHFACWQIDRLVWEGVCRVRVWLRAQHSRSLADCRRRLAATPRHWCVRRERAKMRRRRGETVWHFSLIQPEFMTLIIARKS